MVRPNGRSLVFPVFLVTPAKKQEKQGKQEHPHKKTLAGIIFDTPEQKGVCYRLKLIRLDVVGIVAPTLGSFVCIHTLGGDINLALRSIVVKYLNA